MTKQFYDRELQRMFTWNVSFLKMESSRDITLYLIQAVGSDPSVHPDLISSTIPSMGVPFQNPAFAGWATALPNKARANNNTLLDTILLYVLLVFTGRWLVSLWWFEQGTASFYTAISNSERCVQFRYALSLNVRAWRGLVTFWLQLDRSVRESYLIRILIDALNTKRLRCQHNCSRIQHFWFDSFESLFCCLWHRTLIRRSMIQFLHPFLPNSTFLKCE